MGGGTGFVSFTLSRVVTPLARSMKLDSHIVYGVNQSNRTRMYGYSRDLTSYGTELQNKNSDLLTPSISVSALGYCLDSSWYYASEPAVAYSFRCSCY
jgi:hypothetical protein